MNILKNFFLIILSVFIGTSTVFACKAPTLANSYDSCGVSARSFAMGHTGVALPNNLEGVYYNPASFGFNSIEQIQAEAMVSIVRSSSLDDNELYYANPIGTGFNSFVLAQSYGAVSWRTFSANEISTRNGTDYYKKQEHIKAVSLSMANIKENKTSVGINLSYLYGTITENSVISDKPFAQASTGNGFTMDVGFMTPLKGNLFFGINFENIVGFMWWQDYNDYDQLPFGIRTGLAYVAGNNYSVLVDFNKKFYRFNVENSDDQITGIGFEKALSNIFALRLGIQTPSVSHKDKFKYTYGLGMNIRKIFISAACENYKLKQENVMQYYVSAKVFI